MKIRYSILTYLSIIVYSILLNNILIAQYDQIEVGINEKLGEFIPLDLEFYDSNGDTVILREIVNKPVLLALVYYECPGLCSPLLTELSWVVDKVDLELEEDFKVISLSFDHHENPEIAAKWKRNYFASIKRNMPETAWAYLTGDSVNIRKVTDAIGFYFKPEEEYYLHAGAVVTISPEGKISRYLFGTTFNQFDVKMALLDAQAGKTNPTIAKVLQFCFSYDPEGRKYTINITRIVGSIMLVAAGLFLGFLTLKKKKSVKELS